MVVSVFAKRVIFPIMLGHRQENLHLTQRNNFQTPQIVKKALLKPWLEEICVCRKLSTVEKKCAWLVMKNSTWNKLIIHAFLGSSFHIQMSYGHWGSWLPWSWSHLHDWKYWDRWLRGNGLRRSQESKFHIIKNQGNGISGRGCFFVRGGEGLVFQPVRWIAWLCGGVSVTEN